VEILSSTAVEVLITNSTNGAGLGHALSRAEEDAKVLDRCERDLGIRQECGIAKGGYFDRSAIAFRQ
jgi:hypothetical protein